jgi:UDP-hydrolysing UDP-N-acetyl-D-glucosamine 2-epimerase
MRDKGRENKTVPMKIAILTTARSDFGPLKRVIQHVAAHFEVDLLVAGSHFLSSRGETIKEIERECEHFPNLNIVRFDVMDDVNTASGQVRTVANTQLMASNWFANNRCDLLLFLGDRWELWGVTLPAFLHGIPLAHISGGEVTEGVIDDSVRHSHTKIAGLHFAATHKYAKNISRMGEEDWRISVVGECGLDLIHDSEMATPEEVKALFSVDIEKDTILVTFHPSTLDYDTPVSDQINALLQALNYFSNYQIIFTAPGVEQGSEIVLAAIRQFVKINPNTVLVDHFGSRNYLTVMNRAKLVVGNSSSGLVEAASFGVPAINVGNRQKNRLAADSVLHVPYVASEIVAAITQVLSSEYQAYANTCLNPYDPFRDGKNSLRIANAIKQALTTYTSVQLRVKKFDTTVRSDMWNTLLNESH